MPTLIDRLIVALSLITAAACLKPSIIVPLYQYPGTDCWPDVLAACVAPVVRSSLTRLQRRQVSIAALHAHSQSQCVDPRTIRKLTAADSGPGSDAKDASILCLPKLRQSVPQATIIGSQRRSLPSR